MLRPFRIYDEMLFAQNGLEFGTIFEWIVHEQFSATLRSAAERSPAESAADARNQTKPADANPVLADKTRAPTAAPPGYASAQMIRLVDER